MTDHTIYVTNRSTRVTDADAAAMTHACAHQVAADVAPAWDLTPVPVVFTAAPPKGGRVITLLDTLDEADALGWHTDDAQGIYGVVGASPVLDNGGRALTGPYSVASVLSHEVLELFCDPACTSWSDSGRGFLVATEVCDPVQAGVYSIDGVTVSDFVLPAFFDPHARGPYNHLGTLRRPYTLGKGGYWVQLAEGKATQRFGEDVPNWVRAAKSHAFARAQRRTRP